MSHTVISSKIEKERMTLSRGVVLKRPILRRFESFKIRRKKRMKELLKKFFDYDFDEEDAEEFCGFLWLRHLKK
jgi:hypothetical protein